MKVWLKILGGFAAFGVIKNLNWVNVEQRAALIISAIGLIIIAVIQIKELL